MSILALAAQPTDLHANRKGNASKRAAKLARKRAEKRAPQPPASAEVESATRLGALTREVEVATPAREATGGELAVAFIQAKLGLPAGTRATAESVLSKSTFGEPPAALIGLYIVEVPHVRGVHRASRYLVQRTDEGFRELDRASYGWLARTRMRLSTFPLRAVLTDLLASNSGKTGLLAFGVTAFQLIKGLWTGKADVVDVATGTTFATLFLGTINAAYHRTFLGRRKAFLRAMRKYFERPEQYRFADVYGFYTAFLDPNREGKVKAMSKFEVLDMFETAAVLGKDAIEELYGKEDDSMVPAAPRVASRRGGIEVDIAEATPESVSNTHISFGLEGTRGAEPVREDQKRREQALKEANELPVRVNQPVPKGASAATARP